MRLWDPQLGDVLEEDSPAVRGFIDGLFGHAQGSGESLPCHPPRSDRSAIETGFAFVARSVSKREVREQDKALQACLAEWVRLEDIKAWDVKAVREWWKVDREARENGETIHIGSLHEICIEKGSELPDGDPGKRV